MAARKNENNALEQIIDSLAEEVASLSRIVTDGNGSPPLTARIFALERDVERLVDADKEFLRITEKLRDINSTVEARLKSLEDFKRDIEVQRRNAERIETQYQLLNKDHKFQEHQSNSNSRSKLVGTVLAGLFGLLTAIASSIITYWINQPESDINSRQEVVTPGKR